MTEVSPPDDEETQLSATVATEVFSVGDIEVNQVSVSVPPGEVRVPVRRES